MQRHFKRSQARNRRPNNLDLATLIRQPSRQMFIVLFVFAFVVAHRAVVEVAVETVLDDDLQSGLVVEGARHDGMAEGSERVDLVDWGLGFERNGGRAALSGGRACGC